MANKTLGTKVMSEQPIRWGFDPKAGGFTERVWRGHKDNVGQVTPYLIAAGYSVEVENGPGELATVRGRLAAIDPAAGTETPPPGVNPTEVINTWELLPNKATKDLLHADCSAVAALTSDEIAEIKEAIQNPRPNQSPAFSNVSAQVPVWEVMVAGVEHWEIDQPVLRHTYGVPAGVNPGLEFLNVGKILNTATLFSQEGLPPGFLLPLTAIMSGFTNPTRTDTVVLVYGWKKEMPTLTAEYGGRTSIQVEFKFGLWSTLLYGAAI